MFELNEAKPQMMEPGRHPSSADLRDSSRRVRDATRQSRRDTTDASGEGADASDRRELLSLLDELRAADAELRLQNDELATSHHLLDKERRKYQELFDLAPDAYLLTDVNGVIRDANVAASDLLHVDNQFLVGKSIQGFFEESGRSKYRQQLDQLCAADRLDEWDAWMAPPGGERVPVSITLSRSAAKDEKNTTFRWILRAITRRKEAEEGLRELNRDLELRIASRTAQLAAVNLRKDQLIFAERKAREEAELANRVKSEFLALLSHEIRTPLQAIYGYTELLEREIHGPLNGTQQKYVKRIQQSQEHLLGLITTILDFARLDSGRGLDLELVPVVVNDVLSHMEGFVGAQLETKNIGFSYKCGNNSLIALADPVRLEQIVLNLLSNAIKFTPSGGSITLACDADGSRVEIRVSDSGIGIPADKLEVIFEPFVQLRPRDSTQGGTGLGLPISRRLAAAMGGELTVTSTKGIGSTFVVTLPAATPGISSQVVT